MMKTLKDFLVESCETEDYEMDPTTGRMIRKTSPIEDNCHKLAEGEIKSEDDFREYAENKFKEAFGDDLDTEKMNDTIEGLLNDHSDLVDDENWGELVGMLNKSFAN